MHQGHVTRSLINKSVWKKEQQKPYMEYYGIKAVDKQKIEFIKTFMHSQLESIVEILSVVLGCGNSFPDLARERNQQSQNIF